METLNEKSTYTDVRTRELIEEIANEYLGNTDAATFQAAIVMIAALFVGPDEKTIAAVTNYSDECVHLIGSRLRASGLWMAKGTDYQKWDHTTKIGYIRFCMDLGVAEGMLVRTDQKRRGNFVYQSLIYQGGHVN